MRFAYALLAGSLALGAAGGATAKPRMFSYDECNRHFHSSLQKRHKQAHAEAVEHDRRNHDEHSGARKIAEVHAKIQQRLNREHGDLAALSAERTPRRPVIVRPVPAPAPRVIHTPAPAPAPAPQREHPGRHLGHDKDHPGKGKAKGPDKHDKHD